MRRWKIAAATAAAVLATGVTTAGWSGAALADPGVGNIAQGSSNSHGVWCVQYAFNNLYYARHRTRPLPEDAVFGPHTREAVIWFQVATENEDDGIVGPYTGDDIIVWDKDLKGTQNYCEAYVPTT